MNKKGFILIEVIVGLVLLAIVSITCLPIFMTALNNLMGVKDKTQMLFIAESTIEQIEAFDPKSIENGEYIFDIQLTELINILDTESLVSFNLPINLVNKETKYNCIIFKEEKYENIWEIEVEVFLKKERENNVNIKAFILNPSKFK